nr:MAG TPA: IBV 3A protein [Caudoviricetes sp.]
MPFFLLSIRINWYKLIISCYKSCVNYLKKLVQTC